MIRVTGLSLLSNELQECGVSACRGGLGAIYSKDQFGVTGYFKGSLAFLSGRMQLTYSLIRGDSSAGLWSTFAGAVQVERLLWELEDNPISPRLGLRLQYVF